MHLFSACQESVSPTHNINNRYDHEKKLPKKKYVFRKKKNIKCVSLFLLLVLFIFFFKVCVCMGIW